MTLTPPLLRWVVAGVLFSQLVAPTVALAQYYDGTTGSQPYNQGDPFSRETTYPSSPAATASTIAPATTPSNADLQAHLTAIPAGTTMMIKTLSPITSETNKVGDAVNAVVEADVIVDNQVVVPAGSEVFGSVVSVTPTGRVHQHGTLAMQFFTLKTPSGQILPINASLVTPDNTGILKGNTEQARVLKTFGSAAGITAAGTLAGTALGGLLGATGSGAVFGLTTGAIGGIGYALARKGKPVEVPNGARLNILINQPVAVN